MARPYRIREFAAAAGVTVKALRHYDRLGLLRPQRTAAGHRLYTSHDIERLRTIGAVASIGIPLRQIAEVLASGSDDAVSELLRSQQRAIAHRRHQLEQASEAIRYAIAPAQPGDVQAPLARLVDALTRVRDAEFMRQYFDDDTWVRWRHHYDQWPPPRWQALWRDVAAAVDEDPAGPVGQEMLTRSIRLYYEDTGGDEGIRQGSMRAWRDRQRWPRAFQQALSDHHFEEVARFLGSATMARLKKHGPAWFAALRREATGAA